MESGLFPLSLQHIVCLFTPVSVDEADPSHIDNWFLSDEVLNPLPVGRPAALSRLRCFSQAPV